jgi:hypothetical protein
MTEFGIVYTFEPRGTTSEELMKKIDEAPINIKCRFFDLVDYVEKRENKICVYFDSPEKRSVFFRNAYNPSFAKITIDFIPESYMNPTNNL